jgi:hypothetical protein
MAQPGVISDYVDRLAGELAFDPSLSRCVRQEVEDHLWEAVADASASDMFEAQRRAVANFGDARVIVAQFAVISLAKHSRRVGLAAILVIGSVFVAMKARLAWYAAVQWTMCDDLKAVGEMVGAIDRCAFWLSVVIGLSGFAYISNSRTPIALRPEYRRQLRRFFLLCIAAAAALVVCVISDGVLTVLQLLGTELSVASFVPIFSMAIEIACAGALVFHIRSVTQRTASTAALLKM